MSLPQLVQGGSGEGKLGEQGMRERKRERDKKERRRVWEKNEKHRGWEKRKEEKRSLPRREGWAGRSLSGDAWCYENIILLHKSPLLG